MPARRRELRTCQGHGSTASVNSGERPWLRLVWQRPDDEMEDWTSLGDAVLAMVENAALAVRRGNDSQRRECASPGGGAAYPVSRREGSD